MLTTKKEIESYYSPINQIKSQAYFDNQYVQHMARRVKAKSTLTTGDKLALYNVFSRTLSHYWASVS